MANVDSGRVGGGRGAQSTPLSATPKTMFACEDDEPNVVIDLDSEVDLKQKLDSEVKQFLNITMNADEKVKCNDNVVRDRSSKRLYIYVNMLTFLHENAKNICETTPVIEINELNTQEKSHKYM